MIIDSTEYSYKTELHMHTSPASGCSEIPPEEAVAIYADKGYDSIVISNHFYPEMRFVENKSKCIDAYLADYDAAVEAGKKYGVQVILGCELRFTENVNDYLIFGIDRDFFSYAYDRLDVGLAAFANEFRDEKHWIVQAHPFRNDMTEMDARYLDGVEAFNMHPVHNSRNAVAAKYASRHQLSIIAGTDFHHPGQDALSALLTKEKIMSSAQIVKVLQSGDYLLEIGGHVLLP